MSMHNHTETAGKALWFGRSLATLRVPSSAGEDRISVFDMRMAYGESPPLHVHRNQDEVFHILEGTMKFSVGGHEIVGEAGQTLMAPKGIAHTYRVISKTGARALVITTGTDFESMVREMSLPAPSNGIAPLGGELTDAYKAELAAACVRNGIDIVGPPLG